MYAVSNTFYLFVVSSFKSLIAPQIAIPDASFLPKILMIIYKKLFSYDAVGIEITNTNIYRNLTFIKINTKSSHKTN